MNTQSIVKALNLFLKSKYPGVDGTFIIKESSSPALMKAYKKYLIEVYLHINKENKLVLSYEAVERCLQGQEEEIRSKISIALLGEIFSRFNQIVDEII